MSDRETGERKTMTFPAKASEYWIRGVKTAVSTQDIAFRMAETRPMAAPTGTVVVADRQTGGRGRQGRDWLSPDGGLWLSILLHEKDVIGLPSISSATGAGRFALLALVAGLAVADLAELCGGKPRIKWPNDVLIDGRKIGGVLAESRDGSIVIGIGVNIATPPLPTATTIAEIVGAAETTPRRDECLTLLLEAFAERIRRNDTISEIDRRLTGRDGQARHDGVTVTILGLAPDGGLRVRRNGAEEIVRGGEITLEEEES
jgi:BirA family biotin operon repressor/biotin-[acetyl-CoA-carboxylase] ligase